MKRIAFMGDAFEGVAHALREWRRN